MLVFHRFILCRTSARHHLCGFSLVELSIVLVILGLLTGGILAGQSLIRASELRSVPADINRYLAALHGFRDKYMALPGDMTNAQQFWGVRAAGTNTVCQRTMNVTTGTCNSDGNGYIDELSTGDNQKSERFLFWQHLAYAGLVEGQYTGASTTAGGTGYTAGVNVPASKISSTYYAMFVPNNGGTITGDAQYFDGSYGNTFTLFAASGHPFTPEEVWNMDVKLDDGIPAIGAFRSHKQTSTFSPGCATSDLLTAAYSLTTTTKVCRPLYAVR